MKLLSPDDLNDLSNESKFFRILISDHLSPIVNIIYIEIGDIDYEVFGAYSGQSGAGGLFHRTSEGDISVSDDPADFSSQLEFSSVDEICTELEKKRAKFESLEEDGNFSEWSEHAMLFLKHRMSNINDYIECYSDGASVDYIYDIQDHWNLNFIKD